MALFSTSVPISDLTGKDQRHSVPVLLLAQMAVDKRYQGQGLGTFLVQLACELAEQQNAVSGCVALLVDPLDSQVSDFYAKLGFTRFPARPGRLFLMVETIRKARVAGLRAEN